jgi:hypothetical protein
MCTVVFSPCRSGYLQALERVNHPWKPAIWISSGFDERGAQVTRRTAFQQTKSDPTFGTLPWLRRLHRSHEPEAGPYSICMHRSDAQTVSYTEVRMTAKRGSLRYLPGPPAAGARLPGGKVGRCGCKCAHADLDRLRPASVKRDGKDAVVNQPGTK